jgi:16S rRNA (guanine527-N7)-methyltransferase
MCRMPNLRRVVYNRDVADGFKLERDRASIERIAHAFRRPLLPAAVDTLGRYVELVAAWNRKLDLTAARETNALVEVMLADAFMLASDSIVPTASRCVDVGSGAGAPAIPLALLRGDLSLTLVEPLRKRVAFLRTVVGTLQLVSRVGVIEQKLEPDQAELPGTPYDVAISRATFAPESWLALGRKLAPQTLVLLAREAPPEAAGAELERVVSYTLPTNGAERKIAIYRG